MMLSTGRPSRSSGLSKETSRQGKGPAGARGSAGAGDMAEVSELIVQMELLSSHGPGKDAAGESRRVLPLGLFMWGKNSLNGFAVCLLGLQFRCTRATDAAFRWLVPGS